VPGSIAHWANAFTMIRQFSEVKERELQQTNNEP